MKSLIKKKIFVIVSLLLFAELIFAQGQGGPDPGATAGAAAPLDSMLFIPIVMAVGVVAYFSKKKRKK